MVYIMSIKGRMHNVTQTPSEVVDVDVDSERLQNKYVQTETHLLQSTANDV